VRKYTPLTFSHTSHSICTFSVDLAQLVEETLVGCWWGRTAAKTATETLPIGEVYAPQSPPGTLLDKKDSIEPIIDIEPIPVCLFILVSSVLRF
jgi:hypothetical protein